MTSQQILEAALRLSPAERELLVEELTASLHSGFVSKEIEEAWLEEIERRSAEIDSGKAVLREWPEVRDEILAELRERHNR
jgi:putative addiction module component (TIGR02574 family)